MDRADGNEIGLTVKFSFNCILINKDGIFHVDLADADPLAAIEKAGSDAKVEAPNPPVDVAVTM